MQEWLEKYSSIFTSNNLNYSLNKFYFDIEYLWNFSYYGFKMQGAWKYDYAHNGKLNEFDWNDNGKIFIAGKEMNIGEVSNVLAWLNSYRLWFSLSHPEAWAMTTVEWWAGNGVVWENADHILYDYWYKLWKMEAQQGYIDMSMLWIALMQATNDREKYLLNH